jgi:RNA polymerase sigma-70 factor (ECF subfamily)
MGSLPGTIYSSNDPFASTHWSVVVAAGRDDADSEISKAALAQLCQIYWAPLYSFVRHRGYSSHDAQDLTQSFFAYLIEHQIYMRADQRKGKFRSFLLASLKNFLADASDRERTLKRGGAYQFVPLCEEQVEEAETLFQTQSALNNSGAGEDRAFDRAWAEALVASSLQRLAADYKTEGKEMLFDELKIFLTGGATPLPSYAELAARLGTAASTLRSHVTRLRERYRGVLRAEVRRTVDAEAEVDGELHELFRVFARG